MSDQARNYVKQLPRSRVRGAQKKFLFFVADYHSVGTGCAWPGIQTLADDMGITVRQVRNLLHQCCERDLISWTPGVGNGNLGKFVFLDLQKIRTECGPKEEQKQEIKEEGKGEIKGEICGGVIRKNLEPRTLNLEPGDHHGNAALKAWLQIKEELKNELGYEEWSQWVRPIYFLKELDHKFLLLAAPANNKIVSAYKKRELLLKRKISERGYIGCGLTRYPEAYELERLATINPEWAEVASRLTRKKDPSRVTA
jgi:sugar transport-related sRNA regulator-like protein